MSSIKHISVDFFESRVRFTNSEKPHNQGKEGIREYTNPFISFFAGLFGIAVNVTYKGQMFCLNKNSFVEWVQRNLDNSPLKGQIEAQAADLIAKVKVIPRFEILKNEIEELPAVPEFVKEICQKPPTVEHYQDLKLWRKARDVLIVWVKLGNEIKEEVPDYTLLDTVKAWDEKSKEFTLWFALNKSKILLKVFYLSFSNMKLKELPNDIGKLKELENIYMGYNLLEKVPKEIFERDNIKILSITKNKLKELPKEVGKQENLDQLFLCENQLSELPSEIGNLKKLQDLHVSQNHLKTVPEEIGNLEMLWSLDLSDNELQEIPKTIGKLKTLGTLKLSGNQLKALPNEICTLENLVELDLSGNPLAELPKDLIHLTKLGHIHIKDTLGLEQSEVIAQLKEKGIKIYS